MDATTARVSVDYSPLKQGACFYLHGYWSGQKNIKNSCQLNQTTEIINQLIFKVDDQVWKKRFKISNPLKKYSLIQRKRWFYTEE